MIHSLKCVKIMNLHLSKQDYDLLVYPISLNNKGYVCISINGKSNFLHKVIAERIGLIGEIDHEDRNKLNCKRDNLRICNRSLNMANTELRSNNITGYKGVSWNKKARKYYVFIRINGKKTYLGCFDNELEAAKQYDKYALRYFGEFAYLNFKEALANDVENPSVAPWTTV